MKTLTQSMLSLALATALSAMTAPSAMAGIAAPSFNAYDSNADGSISLEEFQAQGGLVKAFHEGDINRDLSLSKDELAGANAGNDRVMSGKFIDDAWVTAKVKTMLLKDEIMKGLAVKVGTNKGIVQLSGWVNDKSQITRAEHVALSVDGVKSVRNDLQINKR